ncbi:MAG: hypothetical protein KGH84_05890 [Paracoccaceae bacterium]|nr:hypothetical protein [Paracoccaceae bacterium]
MPRLTIPALLVALLGGCATPPDLDRATTTATPTAYPMLLPMAEFDARTTAMGDGTAITGGASTVAARLAALKARAAALEGDVILPADAARLTVPPASN